MCNSCRQYYRSYDYCVVRENGKITILPSEVLASYFPGKEPELKIKSNMNMRIRFGQNHWESTSTEGLDGSFCCLPPAKKAHILGLLWCALFDAAANNQALHCTCVEFAVVLDKTNQGVLDDYQIFTFNLPV